MAILPRTVNNYMKLTLLHIKQKTSANDAEIRDMIREIAKRWGTKER